MKWPNIYLSGGFDLNYDIETEMYKRAGYRYRCFSAAFVIPGNMYYSKRIATCLKASEDCGAKIMLDSGAASFHGIQASSISRTGKAKTKQQKDPEVLQHEMYERYITYVRQKLKEKKVEIYVTFDFIKQQPLIYAMQKKFAKDGLCPMPVFHGETDLSWFKKYADMGVKYIGLGIVQTRSTPKKKRYYLDMVFNEGEKLGLKFHGFGMTSLSLLFRFPFKSVDSSSWTKMAGYGCVLIPSTRGKMMPFHVSDRLRGKNSGGFQALNLNVRKFLREYLDKFGFSLNKARKSSVEREMWNAFVFCNLDKCGIDLEEVSGRQTRWERML